MTAIIKKRKCAKSEAKMCLLGLFVFEDYLGLGLFFVDFFKTSLFPIFPCAKLFVNESLVLLTRIHASCNDQRCVFGMVERIDIGGEGLMVETAHRLFGSGDVVSQWTVRIKQHFKDLIDAAIWRIFIEVDLLDNHSFFPLNFLFL